jgi:hypothetical protein
MKHWQLFLLMILPSFWVSPSPLQEIVRLIGATFYFLWLFAIAHYSQEKLVRYGLTTMNEKKVKTNLIVLLIFIWISILIPSNSEGDSSIYTLFPILYLPTALVFMYIFYAFFQVLFYTAKTIAKLELRREVTFADYGIHVVLLALLFFWIWALQPKLNKEFAEDVKQ